MGMGKPSQGYQIKTLKKPSIKYDMHYQLNSSVRQAMQLSWELLGIVQNLSHFYNLLYRKTLAKERKNH
jgi:hypothetical protein